MTLLKSTVAYKKTPNPLAVATALFDQRFYDHIKKYDYPGQPYPYRLQDLDEPLPQKKLATDLGLGQLPLGQSTHGHAARREICKLFSWGLLPEEVLRKIIAFADGRPIEDHMAGGGYLTYLLNFLGADCTAYDHGRDSTNYVPDVVWETVRYHDASRGPVNKKSVIVLNWPPMKSDVHGDPASEMLINMWTGQRLVYIGEGMGGCTGTDKFHVILSKYFEETRPISWIDSWDGIHDDVYFFEKKRFVVRERIEKIISEGKWYQ